MNEIEEEKEERGRRESEVLRWRVIITLLINLKGNSSDLTQILRCFSHPELLTFFRSHACLKRLHPIKFKSGTRSIEEIELLIPTSSFIRCNYFDAYLTSRWI